MSKINDGGLAFPGTREQQVGTLADWGHLGGEDSPTYADVYHPGMTLRDWFASQAMVSITSSSGLDLLLSREQEALAKAAYTMADAMLKARESSNA